ncbi:MAG: type VI secretion system baseplate subunit TssE [Desulfovibrio sp.]|jgi:type VI secretion system protein|nr:type VI secretion system baseplate subunit TssE [Desulfovibrio sp.]
MQDLTLLERVYALEKGEKDLGAYNPARLTHSLVRHLTAMLNTRRGSVPIAPDYGIADLTDLGSSFTEQSVADLKQELERVIMRFEPRLTDVRVEYKPRTDMPLAAIFSLSATVQTKNGPSPLRLETILDAAGAVRLKEEDESRTYP